MRPPHCAARARNAAKPPPLGPRTTSRRGAEGVRPVSPRRTACASVAGAATARRSAATVTLRRISTLLAHARRSKPQSRQRRVPSVRKPPRAIPTPPSDPDGKERQVNQPNASTRPARSIPLHVTALVAFVSAIAALAASNGHVAHAHGTAHGHASAPTLTQKQFALRTDMRRLWEDHITRTRLAIISLTTGSPDTEATVGRLLKNQTDIGNAVKPFYGDAAGNALTEELRKHILIAAEVVAAAKAGNAAALADAQDRWARNADDIAALLHSVNPRHWALDAMKAELRTHLELTTAEAVARIQGDWAADVAAYEKIHDHALHLSDLLSNGLIEQFPKRFR